MPYPTKYDAHGLAFSKIHTPDNKIPRSLRNIFKEIKSNFPNKPISYNPDLTRWAKQGVMLLNTILTVRQAQPGSHRKIGWQNFTTKTIEYINVSPQPIVFMLWGNNAKYYKQYIDGSHHLILESAHPSPMSCQGFFDNQHFTKCNQFLKQNNLDEIDWT